VLLPPLWLSVSDTGTNKPEMSPESDPLTDLLDLCDRCEYRPSA